MVFDVEIKMDGDAGGISPRLVFVSACNFDPLRRGIGVQF